VDNRGEWSRPRSPPNTCSPCLLPPPKKWCSSRNGFILRGDSLAPALREREALRPTDYRPCPCAGRFPRSPVRRFPRVFEKKREIIFSLSVVALTLRGHPSFSSAFARRLPVSRPGVFFRPPKKRRILGFLPKMRDNRPPPPRAAARRLRPALVKIFTNSPVGEPRRRTHSPAGLDPWITYFSWL